MPPAGRIRPYKDFLTPVLHRRFVTAMALIGILCYVEAMAIGEYTSFFGYIFRTGIRAGIFFISALSVFVLRVAQLHVGFRTSNSAFQTFRQYALRAQNLMTFVWYFFSAWLFGETYIFSTPESAHIKWITAGASFDRPRLNERPIYLMSYFCILSILQAALHLYYDYDRINMPVAKTKPESSSDQRSHITIPPKTQVSDKAPRLFKSALQRAGVMTIVTPPIYWMFIRRQAWSWTLMVAKVFWSLPKSTALPTIAPFHFRVLFRSLTGGTLLILLWEVSNAAFSAYVAQEPLKNERPITHESRDPNGSLLTGLKGKKLQTRAFAFWELVYIAQRFQGRRKLIFEDIDRKGGSAWAQILAVCLEVINGVSERITQYQTPPLGDASAAKPPDESQVLPKLSQPPKDGNIFASSPPAMSRRAGAAQAVSTFAKDRGHSPPLGLTRSAREFVNDPMVQDVIFPGGFEAMFRYYGTLILRSPIGWVFRQEYRRRIAAIVLGTPYGDVGIIVDAIDAVTRLAVCSLTEDKYGNVQRDVKLIIRTLTTTINKLEAFRDSFAPHWTDVEQKKESPETDKILAALKGGLNDLLEAFGDYSGDLGLSQSEMRNARSAATPARERQAEMRETR